MTSGANYGHPVTNQLCTHKHSKGPRGQEFHTETLSISVDFVYTVTYFEIFGSFSHRIYIYIVLIAYLKTINKEYQMC